MSSIRHFTGSREFGKKSIAKEILQIEMQKKGKLPAQMRYKMIFKRREEEAKEKAAKAYASANDMGKAGRLVSQRRISGRAEQALKEVAMKKAAKEQKKMRKMVIVQPQNFSNGHIDKKGQIFDIAGNMVGRVNTKNGAMSLTSGWSIGKYKPKSYMTKLLIEQAINKHSPYFVKLRLMQAQQQALGGGVHGGFSDPNVLNVHGMSAQAAMLGGGMYGNLGQDHGIHGRDENGHHTGGSNGALTAWGAVSGNAWGTFSNNVHGTTMDNVHGTTNADVWGGVGGNSMWGVKGVRLYGTGSGENHLTGITKFILGLFGYQSRAAREALRQNQALRAAGANSALTICR
jgi:hypothetical protein